MKNSFKTIFGVNGRNTGVNGNMFNMNVLFDRSPPYFDHLPQRPEYIDNLCYTTEYKIVSKVRSVL